MGTSAGIFLLIIGLVMGPVYYVYGSFFSGSLASTHSLLIRQQGGFHAFDPLRIELAPGRGKIGLVLRFQTEHGPVVMPTHMPRNQYRAVLKSATRTIFDKPFSLSSTSVEAVALLNFSEALPVFQAEPAGIYQLEISQVDEAGMNLISADVQVRTGVVEPDFKLVTVGVGLLVAGVVALLF